MGDGTAHICMSKQTQCIVDCPEIVDAYIRKMSKQDMKNVTRLHKEEHGIGGMLGSLDMMQVSWGNYSTAWKG